MHLFTFLMAATGPNFDSVTAPIIGLLESIFNVMIPLIGAIGAIYCITLGLKLAKAEEQQDREKAKGALKNAIVGFVLIFVLVVALRIAIPLFTEWTAEQRDAVSSSVAVISTRIL